jgi:hypothetical protein
MRSGYGVKKRRFSDVWQPDNSSTEHSFSVTAVYDRRNGPTFPRTSEGQGKVSVNVKEEAVGRLSMSEESLQPTRLPKGKSELRAEPKLRW